MARDVAMDTAIKVRRPWNKGLIIGQKRPLLPRQVWSIRVRLEMSASVRDLALFNPAIDSSYEHPTWFGSRSRMTNSRRETKGRFCAKSGHLGTSYPSTVRGAAYIQLSNASNMCINLDW